MGRGVRTVKARSKSLLNKRPLLLVHTNRALPKKDRYIAYKPTRVDRPIGTFQCTIGRHISDCNNSAKKKRDICRTRRIAEIAVKVRRISKKTTINNTSCCI